MDPARIDVRGELICGRDVTIDVGCVFEGRVELADGVTVGAHNVIVNATHRRRRADQAVLPYRRSGGRRSR
jgi:bifunctional N-acetylglucosamine-1-phosphate-uridyltransferase/glucosamine-1-phosphate-acetyltransferase GlmU-like protein